ncbi:MAG: hypothetical protein V4819_21315 [Verrucomicrobiota bacterium]
MKFSQTLGLLLALLAAARTHAEVLDALKTRDGKEYLKVEIVANDEVGLRIRHEAGTARIPFESLPADLQRKYPIDPGKAAAKRQEELRAQEVHEGSASGEPAAPRKSPPTPPAGPAAASPTPETDLAPPADDLEKEKLEAYIVELKVRVQSAKTEATKLRAKASMEKSKTRSVPNGVDNKGRTITKSVPDKGARFNGKKLEEEAAAIDRQIARARVLIGTAEAKYNRLMGIQASPEPPP